MEEPGKGHLDEYLRPFHQPALGFERLAQHLRQVQGLAGRSRVPSEVLGRLDEPEWEARYRGQQERRERSDPGYRDFPGPTDEG